jgi:hypothetical protein
MHYFDSKSMSLSVVAMFNEAALNAERVAGAADSAAMADEIDVEWEMLARWDEAGHEVVGLLVRGTFGDKAEAARDAQDVGVQGEDRAAAGEEQHAAGRFRADAFVLLCYAIIQ